MTAKHGHSARPSPDNDGPPTEDLSWPGAARPRRVGARPAAAVPARPRLLNRLPSSVGRRTVLIVVVLAAVLIAVVVVGYRIATNSDGTAATATAGYQLT